MPPRIPSSSLPKQSLPSRSQCQCQRSSSHPFSSTPAPQMTGQRRRMFRWLKGPGRVFKSPLPGSTNYLSAYDPKGQLYRLQDSKKEADEDADGGQEVGRGRQQDMNLAGEQPIPFEMADDLKPYPLNKDFTSQAVLAEDVKEAIYQDVTNGTYTIREASERYKVDMNRVGAVVRLKSVEAQWKKEGKPIASVYGRAVLSMLPQTTLKSGGAHESINDLPVHQATTHQLFYPTSESRHFTRADAGEAFETGLKAADERIPHPEMIEMERGNVSGMSQDANQRRAELSEKMRKADYAKMKIATRGDREKLENTTVVHRGRWDYRFQDVKVDASNTGKWTKGIGVRYGVPPQDRKKGQVKIPRKVI